jgi:hypothetical protein
LKKIRIGRDRIFPLWQSWSSQITWIPGETISNWEASEILGASMGHLENGLLDFLRGGIASNVEVFAGDFGSIPSSSAQFRE